MGIAWQLRALRVPAAVLTYEAKFVQSESYQETDISRRACAWLRSGPSTVATKYWNVEWRP